MKKLLLLLFIVPLLAACGSDNNDPEPEQDYTSFTVVYHADVKVLPNCVVAYKKDGNYYKIAELGDLEKDITSKEVKVENEEVVDLYIFSDYVGTIRFDDTYTLNKKQKNNLLIKDGTKGIKVTDKNDPTQYPQ